MIEAHGDPGFVLEHTEQRRIFGHRPVKALDRDGPARMLGIFGQEHLAHPARRQRSQDAVAAHVGLRDDAE